MFDFVFVKLNELRNKALILLLLSLLILTVGLVWLIPFIFFLGGVLFYFKIVFKKDDFLRKHFLLKYSIMAIYLVLLIVFARLCLFSVFVVPSGSMSCTVSNGDVIYVDKLAYGPGSPSSGYEIPWVDIFWHLSKNAESEIGEENWPHYRLSGYSLITRNDLIVFKSPWNIHNIMIKRGVGMPGDSLEMINGLVFCNNKLSKSFKKQKSGYRIFFKNFSEIKKKLEELKIEIGFREKKMGKISLIANMSEKHYHNLLEYPHIDSIKKEIKQKGVLYQVFPYHEALKWSIDNYGPVFIPKKDSEVELNEINYALYKDIIKNFEKADIVQKDSLYFLNGKKVKNFKFTKDYFFMMGDNRHQSQDSRFWGFVPESRIIGKATMVLWSKGDDGFRWDRFFKLID